MPPKIEGVSPPLNLEKEEIDPQKLEEYRSLFLEQIENSNYSNNFFVSLEGVPIQYRRELALSFIKEMRPGFFIEYLKAYNFEIAVENELALKVIETCAFINVSERIHRFKRLDKKIALILIEKGEGYNVIRYIDHIGDMDIKEAFRLIFNGKSPEKESRLKEDLRLHFGQVWLDKHGII